MKINLVEYKRGSISPFEKHPDLKKIWGSELLSKEAQESITRYNENKTFGEIFLIKTKNKVIGITGYYLIANEECAGLRWHGIIPEERRKGYSKEALIELFKYIKEHEPNIKTFQELAPYNEPETQGYFESIGFIKKGKAEIHPKMPCIKSYKLVLDLENISIEIREINNKTCLREEDRKLLEKRFLQNFSNKEFQSFLAEKNTTAKIIGLFDGDDLLSFLMLSKFEQNPEYSDDMVPQNKLWIHRLFTKEKYRSKGYAKRLIEYCHYLAKNKFHQNEIWIDSTTAGEYYKKLGYKYQFSLPWEGTESKFYKKSL